MSTTTTHPMTAPPQPPPRRKRRLGFKILIGLLALAVLGVGAAIAFVLYTDSKIERIPEEELTALVAPTAGPRTILVVGSDSRENLPDDLDEGNFGTFSGRRTDVIMLVKLVPGEGAQLLSIPRDLKVDIPGEGTTKINAAYVYGGADLLVQTLSQNLGIEVNNYVEVDFGGFAAIVNALGGVELTFDHPARDLKSGLSIEEPGTQTLDGGTALAYARSRHYQELRDGEWVSVAGSDIGRTQRQQQILLAMFDRVGSQSTFNLPEFATTVADNITTDAGLDLATIIELGRAALDLNASDIEGRTLPVKISNENGTSYVIRVEPDAQSTLDAFTSGIPFPAL